MAIHVQTDAPMRLLAAIYDGIDKGDIRTWGYIAQDGVKYLTHAVDQWNRKAWLKPCTQGQRLLFNIVSPKGGLVTGEVYAIYHGRFIEMLLAHFDKLFAFACFRLG